MLNSGVSPQTAKSFKFTRFTVSHTYISQLLNLCNTYVVYITVYLISVNLPHPFTIAQPPSSSLQINICSIQHMLPSLFNQVSHSWRHPLAHSSHFTYSSSFSFAVSHHFHRPCLLLPPLHAQNALLPRSTSPSIVISLTLTVSYALRFLF